MPANNDNSPWNEYIRLVVKELERQNSNFEDLKNDIQAIRTDLAHVKNLESTVSDLKTWKGRVDDVMSPIQMKELKDEVYNQKNKWTATIAILAFIQIVATIVISLLSKFF